MTGQAIAGHNGDHSEPNGGTGGNAMGGADGNTSNPSYSQKGNKQAEEITRSALAHADVQDANGDRSGRGGGTGEINRTNTPDSLQDAIAVLGDFAKTNTPERQTVAEAIAGRRKRSRSLSKEKPAKSPRISLAGRPNTMLDHKSTVVNPLLQALLANGFHLPLTACTTAEILALERNPSRAKMLVYDNAAGERKRVIDISSFAPEENISPEDWREASENFLANIKDISEVEVTNLFEKHFNYIAKHEHFRDSQVFKALLHFDIEIRRSFFTGKETFEVGSWSYRHRLLEWRLDFPQAAPTDGHQSGGAYSQDNGAYTQSGGTQNLPLFTDKQLLSVSLDYLYTHLSHLPMSKAFLLHPELSAILRLLVMVLLSSQQEETVAGEIGGPVHTVPAQDIHTKEHEITKEELELLVSMPEPRRCHEWMRTMFVASAEGEMTQVDFWNLYKDAFRPYRDRCHLLIASDVIKNVNVVFPHAQTMVLPGPPQKFLIRGLCPRKDRSAQESFHCSWNRSQCTQGQFSSSGDLYEHILEAHINFYEGNEISCSWETCSHPPLSKSHIRGHVLTHLPRTQPPPQHPAQADTVTPPYEGFSHPVPDSTTRPPPPARSTTIANPRPVVDLPSSALTALLCIQKLFRSSFASSDAAPRVDEDHTGFPGIVENMEDDEGSQTSGDASEKEGERRGKKAFIEVRHLMERVRFRDETLMGWITEMVDAGTTDSTTLSESNLPCPPMKFARLPPHQVLRLR